jgi:hypothetical protein
MPHLQVSSNSDEEAKALENKQHEIIFKAKVDQYMKQQQQNQSFCFPLEPLC